MLDWRWRKDGSGESTHKPGCLIETNASITLCVCAQLACPQEHIGHFSSRFQCLSVLTVPWQSQQWSSCN